MELRYPLLKQFLFNKAADFEFMFKNGNKRFGSFFVMYSRAINFADQPNAARLGLVVSKKATGNNVKRNLAKRIIREVYRLHQYELLDKQILIVAKRNLTSLDRALLREDLCRLFKKV